MEAAFKLSMFPYVDIFICHAPVAKTTDKGDYMPIQAVKPLRGISGRSSPGMYFTDTCILKWER
jgi:hypothetical protein